MSGNDYDLVVIGGGPAGMSGALAAGAFGKRVAVIERSALVGGAGANTGTIPSKTLRESALVIAGARSRKLLGLDISLKHQATLAEFTHHAANVSAAERARLETRMKETNVRLLHGDASFVDPHTVRVSPSETVRGEVVLVATGSLPSRPKEFPFGHARVHDSDEILRMSALPKRLAVIGAGVIGAEYASTFAALGVEVHVIDGRESLLSFLDRDISAAIARGMEAAGVKFHWKERVEGCDVSRSPEIVLALSSGARVTVSDVLVAAGRRCDTDKLNLSAAGLAAGERGYLTIDEHYRTSVKHIYAAGDVVGAPALAATGMEQARVAVCHAFNLGPKLSSPVLPTGIYTIPEASMAGKTEQALIESKVDYIVGRADYSANPRGRIIGDEDGFLKLLFDRGSQKLLGVHAVGEQATELVHIGLVALYSGAGAELFSNVCFNYPTLGDLYKYAAYDAVLKSRKVRSA